MTATSNYICSFIYSLLVSISNWFLLITYKYLFEFSLFLSFFFFLSLSHTNGTFFYVIKRMKFTDWLRQWKLFFYRKEITQYNILYKFRIDILNLIDFAGRNQKEVIDMSLEYELLHQMACCYGEVNIETFQNTILRLLLMMVTPNWAIIWDLKTISLQLGKFKLRLHVLEYTHTIYTLLESQCIHSDQKTISISFSLPFTYFHILLKHFIKQSAQAFLVYCTNMLFKCIP